MTSMFSVTFSTANSPIPSSKGNIVLIKTPVDSDVPRLIELAIRVFEPFYEGYVHPLLGEEVFRHQHGDWRGDYRRDIPTLRDPDHGRFMALAETDDAVAGFISWKIGIKYRHGEIYLLAVSPEYRRMDVAHELCMHAMRSMKVSGVDVVEIGTGGDPFHAAARELYESLGFTKIPLAAYLKRI